MHFYYAFSAIDFAFGIHGLVPGQQLIKIDSLHILLIRYIPFIYIYAYVYVNAYEYVDVDVYTCIYLYL